jgi:hypothetical protein
MPPFPLEFLFFGLTLAGGAVFHHRNFEVAAARPDRHRLDPRWQQCWNLTGHRGIPINAFTAYIHVNIHPRDHVMWLADHIESIQPPQGPHLGDQPRYRETLVMTQTAKPTPQNSQADG